MGDSGWWHFKAMVWAVLLKAPPTYALQDALAKREGVAAQIVGPCDKAEFRLEGPCIVTINRD